MARRLTAANGAGDIQSRALAKRAAVSGALEAPLPALANNVY